MLLQENDTFGKCQCETRMYILAWVIHEDHVFIPSANTSFVIDEGQWFRLHFKVTILRQHMYVLFKYLYSKFFFQSTITNQPNVILTEVSKYIWINFHFPYDYLSLFIIKRQKDDCCWFLRTDSFMHHILYVNFRASLCDCIMFFL